MGKAQKGGADACEIMSLLDTMLDVAKDETVQQKVVEVARLFYNSPTVTMNLAPAILAISFLMLMSVPLLAFLFQPQSGLGFGVRQAFSSPGYYGYNYPEYREEPVFEELDSQFRSLKDPAVNIGYFEIYWF